MFGRDPFFRELMRMQKEMDSMFDNFLGGQRRALPGEGGENMPQQIGYTEPVADMFETDNEIIGTIEMPGVNKDDIQVNATDNGIEVKVEKKEENKDEDQKKGYYSIERRHTGYYRYFPLPEYAQTDKIDATYNNGVLEIRVPKTEQKSQNKRQIEVK